mgnify:CR=1 FL=1
MTLRWVPGWNGLTDPEAVSYVAAVEAADGQELEFGVARAIDDFVVGCKQDEIWDAIKACCILAGARTLDGALVPLVGAAPTNFNFVSGDYDRETGLVGDGSTKYLDSNRANNADPQNNNHASIYVTTATASTSGSNAYPGYLGTALSSFPFNGVQLNRDTGNGLLYNRNNSGTFSYMGAGSQTGLIATARSISTAASYRTSGTTNSYSSTSVAPLTASSFIHAVSLETGLPAGDGYSNGRIAFYSIGEALDLALLDARVTDLINAFGVAIP